MAKWSPFQISILQIVQFAYENGLKMQSISNEN